MFGFDFRQGHRGNFFLLRADPRASAEKGVVVFTGHGQNDAGGHFHHETLGQLRHVNEPVLMHPDIDESTEVRDICDRGGRRSGRKRPLLADIRPRGLAARMAAAQPR
jgi:hypothetical protein